MFAQFSRKESSQSKVNIGPHRRMQWRTYPFVSVILSPGSKIGHTPRQPFGFTAATSRINAYRGLRSLLILHKPSAAKMYYSTRLPVLQVFFGIFIKFF